jgi:hypothetical protein
MKIAERRSPVPDPASALVLTAISPFGSWQVKRTPTFSPAATILWELSAAQPVRAESNSKSEALFTTLEQ